MRRWGNAFDESLLVGVANTAYMYEFLLQPDREDLPWSIAPNMFPQPSLNLWKRILH